MKNFILFVLAVLCDNIEINLDEFEELHIKDKVLKSKEISGGNSIKLSHSGRSIFKIKEIKPKILKIVDITEYFTDRESSEIRIDIETKIFGMEKFVWKFLLFNSVFTVFLSIMIAKFIRIMCNKYL